MKSRKSDQSKSDDEVGSSAGICGVAGVPAPMGGLGSGCIIGGILRWPRKWESGEMAGLGVREVSLSLSLSREKGGGVVRWRHEWEWKTAADGGVTRERV